MANPFVGEIRMFGSNFAPVGWAFCSGQLLPISQYDTLFNLIGTTYGGDGQNTFALPDLQGRVPIHQGTARSGTPYVIGQSGGSETVTLTTAQLPSHRHAFVGGAVGATAPAGHSLASPQKDTLYTSGAPTGQLATGANVSAGGSQPHDNMMPSQCINFIISLFGVYPSQS